MKKNVKTFVRNILCYMEHDDYFHDLNLQINCDNETALIVAEIPNNGTIEIIFDSVVSEQNYCFKRVMNNRTVEYKTFNYMMELEIFLEENYNLLF